MSLVKRHPIITFFVLAYALAWIIESPLVLLRDSVTAGDPPGLFLVVLASNVPSLLAIVLTAMVLGREALRMLLARGGSARACRPHRGTVALNSLLGRPAPSAGPNERS